MVCGNFGLHWGGFLVDICLSTRCSNRQASSLLLPTALASTSASHWRCFQKNFGRSTGFTLSLVKSTSPTMAFWVFRTTHLVNYIKFVWSCTVLFCHTHSPHYCKRPREENSASELSKWHKLQEVDYAQGKGLVHDQQDHPEHSQFQLHQIYMHRMEVLAQKEAKTLACF